MVYIHSGYGYSFGPRLTNYNTIGINQFIVFHCIPNNPIVITSGNIQVVVIFTKTQAQPSFGNFYAM